MDLMVIVNFLWKKKSEKSEKFNFNRLVSVATVESIDGETTSGLQDPVHVDMDVDSFVEPEDGESVLPTDGIEGKFIWIAEI